MQMALTEDTKVILLLCGSFGREPDEKPLSTTEYAALVRWLMGKNLHPGALLQTAHLDEAAAGSGIDERRLAVRLARGMQLGFAVEEWQRVGIWIVSQSDPDYPARYKKHLQDKAPPLLYGVGDPALVAGGGLAIVGSRNVDADGAAFSRHVAGLCAANCIPVISGGARGVDQTAMTAALEANGVVIGVLPDNLLRKSLERSARKAIFHGNLLLISPYPPEAPFTAAAAMGRNRLIYTLADYSLVVSAEYQKGGSWAGAEQALKRKNSLPVFVRTGPCVPPGNLPLLDLGAIPWPASIDPAHFKDQLKSAIETKASEHPAPPFQQAALPLEFFPSH